MRVANDSISPWNSSGFKTADTSIKASPGVFGYMRPLKQWNPGKRAEFAKRLVFRADSQIRPRQLRESVPAEDINGDIYFKTDAAHGAENSVAIQIYGYCV